MRRKAFRPAAVFLCVLVAVIRVSAGPVLYSQVTQSIGGPQNPTSLRLRSYQDPAYSSGIKAPGISSDTNRQKAPVSTSSGGVWDANSLFSGVSVLPNSAAIGADVDDLSSVEGTICDCGEIMIPGGFTKWPLLFLSAVPLIFIHQCDSCNTTCEDCATPGPTPTPPPSQTPEPASLLLLGTGLAAVSGGIRRRQARIKSMAQAEMRRAHSRC